MPVRIQTFTRGDSEHRWGFACQPINFGTQAHKIEIQTRTYRGLPITLTVTQDLRNWKSIFELQGV
jgi:hypothetical protein